jgi:hypothetical protein
MGREYDSLEGDRDDSVPLSLGDIANALKDGNADVVLQNVELAVAFDTGRHHLFTFVASRGVGLQRQGGAAFGLDHGNRLLRALGLLVHTDYARLLWRRESPLPMPGPLELAPVTSATFPSVDLPRDASPGDAATEARPTALRVPTGEIGLEWCTARPPIRNILLWREAEPVLTPTRCVHCFDPRTRAGARPERGACDVLPLECSRWTARGAQPRIRLVPSHGQDRGGRQQKF